MGMVDSFDGTKIFYKDWGSGPVVTFSHGWPLQSDAWDPQMLFLVQNGFRCVAVDRRGHGRSEQVSTHNDMDGYADDLAAVAPETTLESCTPLPTVQPDLAGSPAAAFVALASRPSR